MNIVAKEFGNSALESAEKVAREYAVSAVKGKDLPTVQTQNETTVGLLCGVFLITDFAIKINFPFHLNTIFGWYLKHVLCVWLQI